MRHKGNAKSCRCEYCRQSGINDRKLAFLKAKADADMAAGCLDCLLCHNSAPRYVGLFVFPSEFSRRIGREEPGMTYYALCAECFMLADKAERAERQIEQRYREWTGTENSVQ